MKALATAVREVWGLFVDDGSLALGLVLWCAVAGLAFRVLPLPAEAAAPLLFIGCVLILLGTLFATARRKRTG